MAVVRQVSCTISGLEAAAAAGGGRGGINSVEQMTRFDWTPEARYDDRIGVLDVSYDRDCIL